MTDIRFAVLDVFGFLLYCAALAALFVICGGWTAPVNLTLVIFINHTLGCVVYAIIDHDSRILKWLNECPSSVIQVAVLQLWPVGLWFRLRKRHPTE